MQPDLPAARKKKNVPNLLTQARQEAGCLLEAVYSETLTARQAIFRWPVATDPSIDVAYQALLYFEADEDRHGQELFYLDAQLALLQQMAHYLLEGQPLPDYILQVYQQHALAAHETRFYDSSRPFRQPWYTFKRAFTACRQVLIQAWQLATHR